MKTPKKKHGKKRGSTIGILRWGRGCIHRPKNSGVTISFVQEKRNDGGKTRE